MKHSLKNYIIFLHAESLVGNNMLMTSQNFTIIIGRSKLSDTKFGLPKKCFRIKVGIERLFTDWALLLIKLNQLP